MMMNIKRQRGMSLWGYSFVLFLLVVTGSIGIKLVPIFIEHFTVVSSLNSLAAESQSKGLSKGELRSRLLKRLHSINDVKNVRERHIKIRHKDGKIKVKVKYEVRETVFRNIALVVDFNDSVWIE